METSKSDPKNIKYITNCLQSKLGELTLEEHEKKTKRFNEIIKTMYKPNEKGKYSYEVKIKMFLGVPVMGL